MNAYELADKLSILPVEEKYINWLGLSANILRKQADKLKKYELRNQEQKERIAYLETQVYGGATK
jgi:hypothetical protein